MIGATSTAEAGSGSGGGCYVSDKFKFVFIHVLKSGGTAIKEMLRYTLCKDGGGVRDCDHRVLRDESCLLAEAHYADYFKWTFVRNPFSRALSQYGMALHMRWNKAEEGFSFEDFLSFLERGRVPSRLSPIHYQPQTDFVFDRKNCPVVDFIGKLENADEDMPYVLGRIGSEELWERYRSFGVDKNRSGNTFGGKTASKAGKAKEDFFTPALADVIRTRYHKDFELLGFDPYVYNGKDLTP